MIAITAKLFSGSPTGHNFYDKKGDINFQHKGSTKPPPKKMGHLAIYLDRNFEPQGRPTIRTLFLW